ncbi:unnamed protein product [Fraxinus pennsylvanica]|uniref:Kinesin light chain n=1 Tax=Fraxinus pennsylvanica TaxID=56036 RepID=A0AAD2AJ09_9LAMI|nr:unnamed protein product [Fraxinus pennsylvanica]
MNSYDLSSPTNFKIKICYGNMALLYHGLNQTELALRHMSRALLLLSLSSGPDHPDVAATFINVAMMYQDIGKMDTALRYLQEALKKNERLLGEEHIQTAHEKKTYDILIKQLGEDDSRTQDSQNWMKTFKMREMQMNAHKQKGKALNAAFAQMAIDIQKAHPDLIHAFQVAAASNKPGHTNVGSEALPRGRGVDERAARAAAEALPPLTQLLNIINSGMTPDGVNNEVTDGEKKESNGHASNGPQFPEDDQSKPVQQDQTPAGLGSALAALDPKMQKTKAKATAS